MLGPILGKYLRTKERYYVVPYMESKVTASLHKQLFLLIEKLAGS